MNGTTMGITGLLSLIALAGAAACGGQAAEGGAVASPAASAGHGARAPADGAHAAHGAGQAMAAGEPTEYSLYHLDAEWRDQRGRVRTLASLAGKVQVVAMVYTHCAHACPRILADMKRLEAAVAAEHPDHVGFVLVSIDPERDTPERLRSYAGGARLDPGRWVLLSGDEPGTRQLAALLGVTYRRASETEFEHSNVITVLDRDGEVVHRQQGLGADPAATIQAIRGRLHASS